MAKHLQRDMDYLRRDLLALSGIVEQMVDGAVRALCDRRSDLTAEVIDQDKNVNQREVRVEEECLKLLALHQPVASDLRRIATVMKLNAELERMADLACNIAERAESLNLYPLFPIPDELNPMADESIEMVRTALDSFVNMDASAASQVIRMDDLVDEKNRVVIEELRSLMKEDPELVEPALHLFSAARHIERIADHAENIAEDVIYLIEGEIVRHKHGAF